MISYAMPLLPFATFNYFIYQPVLLPLLYLPLLCNHMKADTLWPSTTAAVDASKATATMTRWCTHFVTSLALCPHATKVPLNMVVYSNTAADAHTGNDTDTDDDDSNDTVQQQKYALIADQLRSVWTAGNALLQSSTEVSSLVVLPNSPLHWNAFDMFCTTAVLGLDHIGIHTHCYHPLAVVSSSSSGSAAANYRRRAPWPTIHLLKQHAIDTLETGHVSGTMARALAIGNEKELSERGLDAVQALLAECCTDSDTASSSADAAITTTATAATTHQPVDTAAVPQRTVVHRRSRPPARQPKPLVEAVSQQ
jgi:hypothetical protein